MSLDAKKHPEKYADILMHLAFASQKTGYHRQAFTILNSLYPLLEKIGDKSRIIAFYSALGDLCLSFGNMAKPLPCLKKAFPGTVKTGLSALNNIELAVQYLEKGKNMAEKLGSPFLLAGIKNNLANALAADKKYNKELPKYFKRGIALAHPAVHTNADASSESESLYNQSINESEHSQDIVPAKLMREIQAISLLNQTRMKTEQPGTILTLEKALKLIDSLPASHSKASLLISASLLAQKIQENTKTQAWASSEDSIKKIAINSLKTAKKIAERYKNHRMISLACGYL
ncbi:hypothetical protein QUF70_20225, partial [Desulfobacterales bacterium HSG17]|nr:hypothetical protein [Desulfobacterales bacterium HSG17]